MLQQFGVQLRNMLQSLPNSRVQIGILEHLFIDFITNEMKVLIFIMLFSLSATAQTYLKVADKPEYARYEKWCKVLVDKHLVLEVKVKVQAIDGLYADSLGNWVAVYPFSVVLTKIESTPIVEQNEHLITFATSVKTWRRNPTISDFYANWEKIKLEHGIAGN